MKKSYIIAQILFGFCLLCIPFFFVSSDGNASFETHSSFETSVFYKKDSRTNICFAFWQGTLLVVPCEKIPESLLNK